MIRSAFASARRYPAAVAAAASLTAAAGLAAGPAVVAYSSAAGGASVMHADSMVDAIRRSIAIEDDSAQQKVHRVMAGRQLPFYGEPDELHDWIYVVPERSGLEKFIGKVRTTFGPYFDACVSGTSSTVSFFNTTVTNIQEPKNDPIKYGLIALGGLSGAFLSVSRSVRSKFALPIAGAAGMAAFLFPDSIPDFNKRMTEEVHKSSQLSFWFLRSLYCDVMDAANRFGGQKINLVDESMADLYEEDLFGSDGSAAAQDSGEEAAMSMLVTMLPPPPAITATASGTKRHTSVVTNAGL